MGAYFYGANISDAKCQMKNAQNNLMQNEKYQELFIKNQRIVDEKVYKTNLGDIRHVLFDKYTISE